MRRAKFEVYESRVQKSQDGEPLIYATEWRWRMKGGNGEIIASSEAYTRKADALRSARAVKRLALLAKV